VQEGAASQIARTLRIRDRHGHGGEARANAAWGVSGKENETGSARHHVLSAWVVTCGAEASANVMETVRETSRGPARREVGESASATWSVKQGAGERGSEMGCESESERGSASRRGACCGAGANESVNAKGSGRLVTFRVYRGQEEEGPRGEDHHGRRVDMHRVEEGLDAAGSDCDESPVRDLYPCSPASVQWAKAEAA
jgi:hypothetical protein